MSVFDRTDLGPIPTVPDDLDQPNKFGGITELVKDAFVLELRHYLNTNYARVRGGELPRIEKYSVAVDVNVDPLETAVNLIRSYPDITEDMPLIAVMATTGSNLKLAVADNYIATTIPVAKVVGTTTGPYVLANGQTLELTSMPSGKPAEAVTSLFKFPSFMFTDITSATLEEVIAAINFQALYVTAYKIQVGGQDRLALKGGGKKGVQFPNKVTITGGTAATALGFTVSQSDQNYGAGKVAYNRHCISANLTVGIEVVTESENVRTELSDLLFDFFTFVMADRQYQFYGRSIFSADIENETYQIILKDNEITLSGEQETPRSGDPKDKIYVNRVNVPVTAIQYTDRVITNTQGATVNPATSITVITRDDLPEPN